MTNDLLLSAWSVTAAILAKTGSAMTERKTAGSKPGFEAFVERTSAFLPLPPRKHQRKVTG